MVSAAVVGLDFAPKETKKTNKHQHGGAKYPGLIDQGKHAPWSMYPHPNSLVIRPWIDRPKTIELMDIVS